MGRFLACCAVMMIAFGGVAEAVPTCNGLAATIYVEAGFIVGGPDDGLPYLGTLDGTNNADVIVGTDGPDTIAGKNGDDTICALDGNDVVTGDNGIDTINGGSGDDILYGNNGSDTVSGGPGNDVIDGGGGNDTCSAGATTNCETLIETKVIVIVEVNGGPAVPSDFTVRVDGNIVGYLQAPGAGAPGHVFMVEPGYYIVDVAWLMGYAMDREDYGNPSDCIANPHIAEGQTRTCVITMNYLPPATVGDEAVCAGTGWFGEYFNYPWSRDDMYHTYGGEGTVAPGDGFAGTLRGEPLDPLSDAYEWYTPEYSRFSRIDPDLYFGEYYWPFYGPLVEEETYGAGRDFHFGAHWSGTVTVPTPGTYFFLGRLADSLYIYVNDQLQQVLQFQIPGTQFVRFAGALDLSTGDIVDIYYANRTSGGSSAFMLRFLDPNVTVVPYCAP